MTKGFTFSDHRPRKWRLADKRKARRAANCAWVRKFIDRYLTRTSRRRRKAV